MRWPSIRRAKTEIVLTFSDLLTGSVIQEPIQVEIYNECDLRGIFVVRDGILFLDSTTFFQEEIWNHAKTYNAYRFEIISMRYRQKSFMYRFDRYMKEVRIDMALEPEYWDSEATKIY
jgi:hypothetical protein